MKGMAVRVKNIKQQWRAKDLIEHHQLRVAGWSCLRQAGKQKVPSHGKRDILNLSSP